MSCELCSHNQQMQRYVNISNDDKGTVWRFLRSHCFPFLDFWHTYRQLMAMILKNTSLAITLWAPFQHVLAPEDSIYRSLQLSKTLMLATAARIAWLQCKTDFITDIKEATDEKHDFRGRAHIDNLVFTLNYIIPAVSSSFANLPKTVCNDERACSLTGVRLWVIDQN